MSKEKPYRVVKFENGCMIPLSHTPNQDGYFRIYMPYYKTRLPMMYRIVWELHNGPIPDGYEIDHICRCRGCVNPDHLRMIDGKQHAIESNGTRYKGVIDEARKVWENNPEITQKELGKMFGRGRSAAWKWVKKWREECRI